MDIKKRAKIITEWINNYCDSSSYKPKALVVGISGGIDSSVVSTLCGQIKILVNCNWRDDWVAESTSLLMKRTSNRTRGSNPLLSENFKQIPNSLGEYLDGSTIFSVSYMYTVRK